MTPSTGAAYDDQMAAAQRVVVKVAALVVPVTFWRGAAEPFQLPKFTLVVTTALVLIAVAGMRAVARREIVVRATATTVVLTAFAGATAVALLSSPTPMLSLVGEYGRYTGTLSYLAYVVITATIIATFTARDVQHLVVAAVAALGVVAAYGLVQYAGVDPFTWTAEARRGQEFASLGNPNFLAGWLAIVLPLAVHVALEPHRRNWRIVGVAVAVATGLVIVAAESLQGPVALVAGLLTQLTLRLIARDRGGRAQANRNRDRRVGVIGALAALIVSAMLFSFLREQVSGGLGERRYMWRAAASVIVDHPVLGTGMDTFANEFFAHRPAQHAVRFGQVNAESPHNVPLAMFASGGILLGVAYFAAVLLAGIALVRGFQRAPLDARRLLAAVGAAWVAYHVQSLVSVDMPALGLFHWLLIGCIVAASRPPGDDRPRGRLTKYGASRRRQRRQRATRLFVVVGIVVAAACAGGLVLATRPLRADVAANSAVRMAIEGENLRALQLYAKAERLAPWESTYPFAAAAYHEAMGQMPPAIAAAQRAAALDPGDAPYALLVARLADRSGDTETGVKWYLEAARRDPQSPVVLEEAANFLADHGQRSAASDLLRRAEHARSVANGSN